jgi:hypothetical protein
VGRNYVTIWDQWDGPVHTEEETEAAVYRSLNAEEAVERDLLSGGDSADVVQSLGSRLEELGVEALRLRPEHLLMSIGPDGALVRNEAGDLEFRLCNLQFMSWKDVPEDVRE